MGFSRLWVAHQNQRAKNPCAAPREVDSQNWRHRSVRAQARATVRVTPLEIPEGRPLRGGHGLRAQEPEGRRPREPVILGLLQSSVLSLAHPVHRVVEGFGDMELLEDELRRGVSRCARVD